MTVYAWGALADRLSERLVLAVGLTGGAFALVVVARADGYRDACWPPPWPRACSPSLRWAAAAGRCSAGLPGASAEWPSACGKPPCRSVRRRPPSSCPALAAATGLDTALLVLAGAMLTRGAGGRDLAARATTAELGGAPAPPAARDPRIWRLGMASALLIVGQVGITSLLVLYLFGERGWSATAAAFALGFTQLGGAAARIAAGRWSDRRDERIGPFRTLAAVAGVLLLAAAALSAAPDALFVPRGRRGRGRGDELERALVHGRGRDLRADARPVGRWACRTR